VKLFFEKNSNYVFLFIFLITTIRLLVSPTFGLGVDEAHYVLYAKHLDLSYFDHPPLVGWIHSLFFYTLGSNEFLARLPAILTSLIFNFFLYYWTLDFSQNKSIAFASVFSVNLLFMVNALFIMFLPDTILMLMIFPLIFITRRLENNNDIKAYIYAGIIFGLLGLTKYTSIIFVPMFVLYFIIIKRFDVILNIKMLILIFIAILIISPVIIWNINNDFISFKYQTNHVIRHKFKLKYFFRSLGGQIGAYNVFFFLIAFYGFFKSIFVHDRKFLIAKLYGGSIIIFFTITSFTNTVLPHWTIIFYVLFVPIGIFLIWQSYKGIKVKFFKYGIIISSVLILLLFIELGFKIIPFPNYNTLYGDIYGYKKIMQQANELFKKNNKKLKAIAVTNWTYGSRVNYYGLKYNLPVFVIDRKFTQFDLWENKIPKGYDLLIIKPKLQRYDMSKILCDNLNKVKTIDIKLRNYLVNSVDFYWCHNFIKVKP
jgi:4-amino-4-deoxy-L-arabinose transferase-like glycosyltransferase